MKLLKTRLSRWLKITTLSLLGVICLISASVFLIIGTESGIQWLFSTVNSQLGGKLTYSQLHGHLLGDFRAKDLSYEDDAINLKVNDLVLAWQPGQLLDGRFNLVQLSLDTILFEQKMASEDEPESDTDESKEKIELSDIVLPIDIIINEIKVTELQFISGPDVAPLVIEQLSLQAEMIASKVTLSHLMLTSPDFDVAIDGRVDLTGQYPLQINSDIQLHRSELPVLTLQGPISGDLANLAIKQSLSGDVAGQIDVNLQQVISELTWDTTISLRQIPFRLLDKSFAENKEAFDVLLSGKGDLSATEIQPLQINLSKGEVTLAGNVGWQPALKWDLKLNTENLDPGVVSADLQGDINLQLESTGAETAVSKEGAKSEFNIIVALKKLQGTLLEQPLSGEGFIELNKQLLIIKQLHLASGEAKINIDGKADLQAPSALAEPIDLKWDIDIPTLEKLLPGMKGLVKGQGKLSGTQSKPLAEGQLQINQFSFQNNLLNQAKLDFAISLDENFSNHLSLSVDKIQADSNEIKDTLLTFEGPLTAHRLDLKSRIMGNQLNLGLKGGYVNAEQSWQGNIEQLSAKGPVIGSWQQKQATPLLLSAKKAVWETLCLIDRQSNICTTGQWQPEQTKVELKISKLNLARIKSFLPKEINEFSGEVNLDSELDMQQTLAAKLELELTPGVFSYRVDANKTIRLKHKNGRVQAVYGEQQLTANVKLNMDEHSIEGNVAIPRTALEANPETAPLKGNVKLNVTELGLITAFVPEIKDMEGYVRADIDLAGVISDPTIIGTVEFISEKITVPLIGGEFSQIDIKLNAKANKQIDLKGKIHSGQGDLSLNGNLLMDANKNWPVNLTIQGDKFQVLDLPDMQAMISPDIKVEHGKNGIKLLGQVTIPEAGIFLTDLPAGSRSVSDDTVIVGEKKKAVKNTRMGLDMTFKLGSNVHIKAFGLDTHLTGQMRIRQSPGQLMTANGELKTVDGTFRAYGQDLNIEQGRISYAGGYLDNPGVNIKAGKDVQDVTVGVMASGTAKELEFDTYSSDPGLDSKDITSLLLTGQKFDSDAGARIYAGKEITDELDVGVNLGGGEEGSEFVVRYQLRKNLHLEGTSSSEKSGGSLMYTIELE